MSAREQILVEGLHQVIEGVTLQEGSLDKRIWIAEPDGAFTVQTAYKILQAPTVGEVEPVFNEVWNSKAPSNVCAFIWKVMWDRIPMRINLLKRKVIRSIIEARCPLCLEKDETSDHLLISCPFADKVWINCYRWIGVNTALSGSCRLHLLQHYFVGFNAKQNELFKIIWFAETWSLWLIRNQIIFRGGMAKEDVVLEGAIIRAWHWATGRMKGFQFSIYEWISQPELCIRMVG